MEYINGYVHENNDSHAHAKMPHLEYNAKNTLTVKLHKENQQKIRILPYRI